MGFLKYGLVQIGIVAMIGFLWILHDENQLENEKKMIYKDGIILKATIKNVYNRKSTRLSYYYDYLGKQYDDAVFCENCPYFIEKCKLSRKCIGDTILIKMSKSNPENTMIIKYSVENM